MDYVIKTDLGVGGGRGSVADISTFDLILISFLCDGMRRQWQPHAKLIKKRTVNLERE